MLLHAVKTYTAIALWQKGFLEIIYLTPNIFARKCRFNESCYGQCFRDNSVLFDLQTLYSRT